MFQTSTYKAEQCNCSVQRVSVHAVQEKSDQTPIGLCCMGPFFIKLV